MPSNFCPVPWLEAYVDTIGDARPCCLENGNQAVQLYDLSDKEKHGFYNTPVFTSLRRSFLKNERTSRCQKCWGMEDQGLQSQRQRSLLKYENEAVNIWGRQMVYSRAPKRFDVRLSNHCNVQCKMCSPSNSNQIAGLIKRLRAAGIRSSFTERSFRDDNQSRFLAEYIHEHESIESFLFAGGEPFIMPEFNEFLDVFIENGRAANSDLHVLTNLTAVKDPILQKLAKFRSIDLSCSMDGIGAEFEFQRYPSRWEKVRANFERVLEFSEQNPQLGISLTPCITHLNVRSLPDYLRYVHSQAKRPIYSGLSLVLDPEFLNYLFVPLRYRREIARDLDDALASVKHNMWPSCHQNWTQFRTALVEGELDMSTKLKIELQDAVQAWEFEAPLKFRDLYPWADELLNFAHHPEIDLV